MFNLDSITNKNNKDNDKKRPYRMLITGSSGSGKTNALHNLIQRQDNDNLNDDIYLYANDLSESKYQFLIKKCDNAGMNTPTLWMMFTTILIIKIQKEKETF